MLAGASKSGKTTFTLNLLRNIDQLFVDPSCLANVIYFFNEDQPALDSFKEEGIVHHWYKHLPTTSEIDTLTAGHLQTGSIIVIDDFQEDLTSDTVKIFTNKCHHRNASVILLAQNIFCPKVGFRTISLNTSYIVLFKNPRDTSQITSFAKQFSSGNIRWVLEAFKEATRDGHSYLLFDLDQLTPDWLRVRSKVLPHQLPMTLYYLPTVKR